VSSLGSRHGMSLADKAERLRAELGLEAGPIIAIIEQASTQLGLDAELRGMSLVAKADACMLQLGASAMVPMGTAVVAEAMPVMAEVMPIAAVPAVEVKPRPRIYVTDMVGGSTGVSHPRAGSARPRLIEWPTMAELNAMQREQLESLHFTAIGWKARGGLDALKFWRNDGAESPFFGACPRLNGSAHGFGDLSNSFKTAHLGNAAIRGVTVFWYMHDVTGLALLGEGGRVIAQEGPGSCRQGFGQRTFTFGPTEKLVGFKFYTDHCTPQLACIVADMYTPQGGVISQPAGHQPAGHQPPERRGGDAGLSAYDFAQGCWCAWGTCCLVIPVLGSWVCLSPRTADHYHHCAPPLISVHWKRAHGNSWNAYEGGPDDPPGNQVGCNVRNEVQNPRLICERSDCCFNGCYIRIL